MKCTPSDWDDNAEDLSGRDDVRTTTLRSSATFKPGHEVEDGDLKNFRFSADGPPAAWWLMDSKLDVTVRRVD
jgi:hypothetical protein